MNKQAQDTTIAGYFKASKILFGAFILGVINLGLVILVLFFLEALPLGNFNKEFLIFFIIASVLALIVMTFVGNMVFKSKTTSVENDSNFSKKLSVYREAKLIQAVTLEGSALLSMVFLMINTHVIFLVVSLLSLIQMIRVFPKKQEMIEVLKLSYAEQQLLNDPDYDLSN
jgi:membrane protein implicated in regulation of membrane protease activity